MKKATPRSRVTSSGLRMMKAGIVTGNGVVIPKPKDLARMLSANFI